MNNKIEKVGVKEEILYIKIDGKIVYKSNKEGINNGK